MIVTRIDRYLARLIFVPLLGTLCLAAMLLLLDRMLKLFDFVVSEGGPVTVVWQLLANLIPEYMGLAIPVGLTLGVLLAFRKLALSSELNSLRAVGLGYWRLLRVPYAYGFVLLLLNLWIVGFLQPKAQYNYQNLRFELSSGALGASIKVGEFTNFGRGMTLRIERSENHGTDLYGVFLRMVNRNGGSISAAADRGRFLATDDPNTILFRLRNGRLIQQMDKFAAPRALQFTSYDLPINLPAIDQFRGRGKDEDELTLIEVARRGYGELRSQNAVAAQANTNYRLVEALMMLMLPLLAVALAVPPKRSTSSLGIFVAIVMIVTYHKINQYGEEMGAQGRLDPLLSLWGPFVLLIILISWMYYVIAHRPGGQPIGALERFFAKAGKLAKSMMKRRLPGSRTTDDAA